MKTNLIKLVLYDSLAGKTKCHITVAFNIFFLHLCSPFKVFPNILFYVITLVWALDEDIKFALTNSIFSFPHLEECTFMPVYTFIGFLNWFCKISNI